VDKHVENCGKRRVPCEQPVEPPVDLHGCSSNKMALISKFEIKALCVETCLYGGLRVKAELAVSVYE